MSRKPLGTGTSTSDYEGVSQPVGQTGGSTNQFVKKPELQEHKFYCICNLCEKDRGNSTGGARVYSQWYISDPVYPE